MFPKLVTSEEDTENVLEKYLRKRGNTPRNSFTSENVRHLINSAALLKSLRERETIDDRILYIGMTSSILSFLATEIDERVYKALLRAFISALLHEEKS